ncbi:hypothetical protein L6452_11671 [Arctium lappa]|uniref:Uncharacterized protein n=1 Tax=Arctium lappa TaxID=4217 RepID=A0ACB9DQ13_ARCLA|nr:hypothetical protein L6452_11671 [Arctium lappa]
MYVFSNSFQIIQFIGSHCLVQVISQYIWLPSIFILYVIFVQLLLQSSQYEHHYMLLQLRSQNPHTKNISTYRISITIAK